MHTTNEYLDVDDSNYPVVVYRFSDIDPSEKDFDEYLKVVSEMIDRPGKVIQLMDASQVGFMKTQDRIKAANFLRDNRDRIQKGTHAYVFVTKTLITRFLIHGILQIQPLPVTYRLFDSFEKAHKWSMREMGLEPEAVKSERVSS
ncbi:MAG: hypothetical protein ACFB10_26845 [Salibacteraceae bacterium]